MLRHASDRSQPTLLMGRRSGEDVCRRTSCLPSSGNVRRRTFFSPGTRRCALFGITAAANLLFRLDKVLRGRHVASYIEFAISDLQPSFEQRGWVGKKTANAELGGLRERKSCREETSKDDCNFLKGSEEAGCGTTESHWGTETETGPGHRKCDWRLLEPVEAENSG